MASHRLCLFCGKVFTTRLSGMCSKCEETAKQEQERDRQELEAKKG